MYVMSLSNISIKNKSKTNNKGWIEINKFVQYSDVTLSVAVHSQMTCYIQFNHCQCHCIIIWQRFFWRNMDCTVAGNIEDMPLEMIIWPWNCDT
jgi:hypothetical protein